VQLWTFDSDSKLKEAVHSNQNAFEEQKCSRCKRRLVNLIVTDGIITCFQVPIDAAETPHVLGRCDLSTRTYIQTFRRIVVPLSSGSSPTVKMNV
jgi:hypothetical protein